MGRPLDPLETGGDSTEIASGASRDWGRLVETLETGRDQSIETPVAGGDSRDWGRLVENLETEGPCGKTELCY